MSDAVEGSALRVMKKKGGDEVLTLASPTSSQVKRAAEGFAKRT
jgi:hypothetical protein